MASDETWNKLRYFKKNSSDRWGDTTLISDDLLLRLDDFRHYLGCAIHVSRGVATTGHAKASYHYAKNDRHGRQIGACAVDIIIPDFVESPFDLIMDASRFGFTGIGYYPHWRWRGVVVGGLHLDMRPLKWDKDETINYSHSRWMGIPDGAGGQRYIELNHENLIIHSEYIGDEFDDEISRH